MSRYEENPAKCRDLYSRPAAFVNTVPAGSPVEQPTAPAAKCVPLQSDSLVAGLYPADGRDLVQEVARVYDEAAEAVLVVLALPLLPQHVDVHGHAARAHLFHLAVM